MAQQSFPYSFPFNAGKVVDRDVTVTVEPTPSERHAIAKAYEIEALEGLRAAFVLRPYRKAGVRVVGTLRLTMTQICVVSLEPFESTVELDVDRTFEPHSSRARKIRDLNEDGEIEIDLESLDPRM